MDVSGCAATELTLPLLLLVGFARTPIVGQGTADVDEQREKKRSEDAVYAEGVKRETSDECEKDAVGCVGSRQSETVRKRCLIADGVSSLALSLT